MRFKRRVGDCVVIIRRRRMLSAGNIDLINEHLPRCVNLQTVSLEKLLFSDAPAF